MLFLGSLCAPAAPGVSVAVREAFELAARRSGRKIPESSAREAGERILERSVAKFGDKALAAAGDGGLELIEATAKYGDDVMRFGVVASPAARRVLALSAEDLLPLARRIGPEALELETKVPGHAAKVFAVFGEDAGKIIAKNVPADDIPRLLSYAEKADSQATRRLLLECYQKEGKQLFERIPPRLMLAGGLTAAMLYGTHGIITAIKQAIAQHPLIAQAVVNHAFTVFAVIFALIAILLLWRFGLLPWQRKTRLDMPTPSGNPTKPQEEPKHIGEKETVE
ncbi:MAG: hypothetical protein ACLQM8_24990 [Limisphaerales bacterium]